ncbi:hypothetical protein DFA_10530 [Cavenderia fasciculata]|uniref:VASt domain-containing protein n=1 Tax=Cavenderia fasciculata TaxID=261658 RepID=F4QAG9_CACFS|nr:uncharacterized protein DFA_10530 [Cavenderia fasciculata]EGG15688.1 hypothetical protein DFA_10530 [Cavenderia fasciculata]|eukprot:XP_004354430.1 hypothetical protein DFA_10530 [Cavenderia fasciculata]
MKLLHLEEEFNISVDTFFAFFFEGSGFKQRYHTSRGDTAIEVKPWTPLTTGGYTREVCFCSFISNNPVINRLVGDKAKVREVQKYIFQGESILNVSSETFFEGSSIGKSFQAETEWNVIPSTTKSTGCRVTIDVKNNYNGTMFKSVLENWVHETTEASFKQWLSLVGQQVEEYEQSEKLKRAAPTPVKQPQPQPQQQQTVATPMVSSSAAAASGVAVATPQPTMNGKHSNKRRGGNHNQDPDGFDVVSPSPVQKKMINIVDENHGNNLKNHLNHLHNHNHNHNHRNNNINGGWGDSDSEDNNSDDDNMSEFSNPPAINEDFLNEASEYDYEDELEGESGEDQFFDSNDQLQHNGDLKNYMVQLVNELNSMKSIVEVNHTRLLGLETAFSQLQLSRATSSSSNTTTTSTSSPSVNGKSSSSPTTAAADNHTHQLSHTSSAMINGIKLSSYVANLEELVKNHQEEEYKSKEHQKQLEAKAKELEERLNQLHNSSKRMSWFSAFSVLFLVVGWPVIEKKHN